MTLPWRQLVLLCVMGCLGGELPSQGPMFITEPSSSIVPAGLGGQKVTLACEARGSPPPRYRWQLNGSDIDLRAGDRYELHGGTLVVSDPRGSRDAGTYRCLATNSLGTIVSREARLQFAYLENFKGSLRSAVSVREGQGVVLLCGPPPHAGELSYAWIFNEYPSFVEEDSRRFVSQETGHLYIAKVEPSDVGNYTCVVTSSGTAARVPGAPTPLLLRPDGAMGEYEPKIEVHFPESLPAAKGSTVRLECFALGNPVPRIAWRRGGGLPLPQKAALRKAGGVLEVPDFQQEDAGSYECVAENSRGRNAARGRLTYYAKPHWVQPIEDVELAVEDSLTWQCRAGGKPTPSYRWLKDGAALALEDRIQVENGALTIANLSVADAGMFQCVAENKHGLVRASAELRVTASAPDFSRTPMKTLIRAQVGSEVSLDCRPRAAPRAVSSWRKGHAPLRGSERVSFRKDGGLRIVNLTKADAGTYTCVAENRFGTANGTTHLVVTERIWRPHDQKHPAEAQREVRVRGADRGGERVVRRQPHGERLPGTPRERDGGGDHRHHGPALLEGRRGQPQPGHVLLGAGADALLRGLAGRHDSARGHRRENPHGHCRRVKPLGGVRVPCGSQQQNRRWRAQFTVRKTPEVPPSEVSGGGGSRSELVITWDPVPEELQNGEGFGYVVAFRPLGVTDWIQTVVTSADTPRYVFRNDSIAPFSLYEVKVGVYNNRGEGPFSPVTTVFSAEEEPTAAPSQVSARSLSASEIGVSWGAVPWKPSNGHLLGYEVRYWSSGDEESASTVTVAASETSATLGGLRSNLAHHAAVRAYNSAGAGPFSTTASATTRRPPPSRPPGNVVWNTTDTKVLLSWDRVRAAEHESAVTGYKVFYRTSSQRDMQVLATNKTSVELLLPIGEDCVVEVRATTDGGDGASSEQVRIPGITDMDARGSTSAIANVYPVSSYVPITLCFVANALW
ncbi:contactin-3 isoform X3 [Rousettus aegyptiacus]|uniref:contactin-3 isoform X3 n=1 Tax=Rousettus aegyptiacus TaxID=9407 RepID=UPI00168D4491|nr:contactin-3 isoform X3 [Rousettus aegyptiacus]